MACYKELGVAMQDGEVEKMTGAELAKAVDAIGGARGDFMIRFRTANAEPLYRFCFFVFLRTMTASSH